METFHVCVAGLHGVGKTHFINVTTIGEGFTILPTRGIYEETLCLDEGRQIHLVECPLETLGLRKEAFCGLLWILDAHGSYEEFQSSRNTVLPHVHKFERIGVVYNVRGVEDVSSFRERNRWLQLECLENVYVIEFGTEGWEERVWRLWRFFTGENGG